MSDRVRNVTVGLTILVALAVCMYGIILLGKFPLFGTIREYQVALITSDANGITTGVRVELNGVYAGQVKSVYLTSDANGLLIAKTELKIERNVDIPASASAVISRPTAGVGNPSVDLKATEAKGPMLPKDGTAVIMATAGDSGLIPKDVRDNFTNVAQKLGSTADQLTIVARDLHTLLAYTTPESLENVNPNDPNRPRENASTMIIRVSRTVESLQKLLTDPKLQGNVREAIQNIADASAQLKETLQKIDATAANADGAITSIGTAATKVTSTLDATQKDINRVTDQLVQTLASLEKSIKLVTEGNGTTGLLANDPRLYKGLVDLSQSLKETVSDLDFLLKKWKDEGVDLRLK